MKKLLTVLAIMAGVGFAQTTPPVPVAARAYVILSNGVVQFLALDPSTLVINNGMLSVIVPKPVPPPMRIVEITQVAVPTPTYTLGQAANATAPELDVFWNGLCLSVGVDYTVAGNVVTFTVGPGPGDVLRVVYRGAP